MSKTKAKSKWVQVGHNRWVFGGGDAVSTAGARWPMKDSAILGCSPSQVAKWNEIHRKAGTGVTFSGDGKASIPSPRAYDRYCKLHNVERTNQSDD